MNDFWRDWKITDEQATAIINGDIEARNRFYMDNLTRIRKMAKNYQHRNPRCVGLMADMVQNVFCDMPLFDFTNGASVSRSVYRSFYYTPDGGWWYVEEFNRKLKDRVYKHKKAISIDTPAKMQSRSGDNVGEGAPLLDMFISTPSPEDDIINGDRLTAETLEEVAGKYLSKQEKLFFVDLMNGYEKHNICARLGVKNVSKQYDRMCAKLRANYADILTVLSSMGVALPRYALQAPADYETAVKKAHERKGVYSKMTAEQKSKAYESSKRWRAKKRLTITPEELEAQRAKKRVYDRERWLKKKQAQNPA